MAAQIEQEVSRNLPWVLSSLTTPQTLCRPIRAPSRASPANVHVQVEMDACRPQTVVD